MLAIPEACNPETTEHAGQNCGHDERKTRDARSREICPGGVEFETRSASGGRGAVLVANLTRPVIDGVSVRVIGIRLGLQFSKTDDKHVNVNGEFSTCRKREEPKIFRFCLAEEP
jgi:hypothetical protein